MHGAGPGSLGSNTWPCSSVPVLRLRVRIAAEAFRVRAVHDAEIGGGALGEVAVTYMEWAGAADQKTIVPWTILDNPERLMSFADKIASTP